MYTMHQPAFFIIDSSQNFAAISKDFERDRSNLLGEQ
jgi:hypothetical protein